MEQITFRDIIQEYANIFWDGDFQNAKEADQDEKEQKNDNENTSDLHFRFENYAKGKQLEFIGEITGFYRYEPFEALKGPDGKKITGSKIIHNLQVACEYVFITDQIANQILFALKIGVHFVNTSGSQERNYLRLGEIHRFNGRIKYCSISWGELGYGGIYEMILQREFEKGAPLLSLDVTIEVDAQDRSAWDWVDRKLYRYDGEDFGFSEGIYYPKSRYTADSSQIQSSKRDGMCFIATAAYGSGYNNEIDMLYNFRDHILSKLMLGKALIKTYYVLSPPLAKLICQSESLKKIVRNYFLSPIVSIIKNRYTR